jgi:hypothetical protein
MNDEQIVAIIAAILLTAKGRVYDDEKEAVEDAMTILRVAYATMKR